MRSIASAARWAAYLLVTATMLVVIVACPEGPAGEPGQPGQPGQPGEPGVVTVPPLNVGEIAAITVEAGKTSDAMDVAKYFNEPQGEALTYTAMSSAPTVATAEVATGTSSVTVTGVAAGEATITVTATDPTNLSAKQTFMVTVTAAAVIPVLEGCTLENGKTCDVTILATQELQSEDSQRVSVARKARSTTIWVVTGHKKGDTEVRVLNSADRSVASTFIVTVNNRPPKLTDMAKQPLSLILMKEHDQQKTLGLPRAAYLVPFDRGAYIKDADTDPLTWKESASTSSVIILTYQEGAGKEKGYIVDLTAEVSDFEIMFSATDDSDAASDMATVRVRGAMPRDWTYEIEQYDTGSKKGGFAPETVGLRVGVEHMLEFLPTLTGGTDDTDNTIDTDDERNLEFLKLATWPTKAGSNLPTTAPTDWFLPANAGATPPTDPAPSAGNTFLMISVTHGPIKAGDYMVPADDANPMLKFTLTGGAGRATIKFQLMVYYDADDNTGVTDGVNGPDSPAWHEITSKTLDLTIAKVEKGTVY